jgi:hypothetical protein
MWEAWNLWLRLYSQANKVGTIIATQWTNLKKQLSIMWLIIATVLMASAIVGIMVLKAMGRSVMNKPTWKGGIISGLLGLLPFYLLLCLFGFMGIEREEEY